MASDAATTRKSEAGDSPDPSPRNIQPRFSRTTLYTIALVGMIAVGLVAYFGFDVQLHNGQLAVIAFLALIPLLAIGQFIRHRQRISLRTLLIIVAVLGVGLAIIGRKVAEVRRETLAMETLVERGGRVTYGAAQQQADSEFFETEGGWFLPTWIKDWTGDAYFLPLRVVSLANADVEDEDLALLTDIRGAEWLRLHNPNISAEGIANMSLPTGVKRLSLNWHQLTQESAAHLASLPDLEQVSVYPHFGPALRNPTPAMPIRPPTDLRPLEHFQQVKEMRLLISSADTEGIRAVAGLPELNTLFLGCAFPNVRGTSYIKWLSKSTSIRSLAINIPSFGDAQLRALKEINSLQRLELTSTSVLYERVSDFHTARPDVTLILTPEIPGLEDINQAAFRDSAQTAK